jgi:uncharacterized protein (DUF1499 family)
LNEPKTSTRFLLVSAVIALLILLLGPLGYRFSVVELLPSLVSLLVAMAGGLLVGLAAIIYLVIAMRRGEAGDRNLLIVALILGLVPTLIMAPQMQKGRSVPPIHDISTDTENPPGFVAIAPLRADAPNVVEYGSGPDWPAEKLAATTKEAYPDLAPLISELSVEDAVERAAETLGTMGLELVAVDKSAGLVEATDTTLWFGFKDDMVVRVVAEADGSRIDIRSKSRVGQGDVGANAARIQAFVSGFKSG